MARNTEPTAAQEKVATWLRKIAPGIEITEVSMCFDGTVHFNVEWVDNRPSHNGLMNSSVSGFLFVGPRGSITHSYLYTLDVIGQLKVNKKHDHHHTYTKIFFRMVNWARKSRDW